MEYSRIDDAYHLRVAKGEHVPRAIVELCRREHVEAAQISGIDVWDLPHPTSVDLR